MNLVKLFEMQRKLDEKIYKRFPDLKETDWSWKILALQVELGECANEWRGFKMWSDDRQPRKSEKSHCIDCKGGKVFKNGKFEVCAYCNGSTFIWDYPLLEEYVDCLHFILSIGLESADLNGDDVPISVIAYKAGEEIYKDDNITLQFNNLFLDVASLYDAAVGRAYDFQVVEDAYVNIVGGFVGLGEMLGFTWEQTEQAYRNKNKVNHARQDNGY